jgi:hypothetical protein
VLLDGDTRLVVVVGAGGACNIRLALELARDAMRSASCCASRTLDEDDFAAAWAEGLAWRSEQAVDAACAWTTSARVQSAASSMQTTIPVP